MRHIINIMSRVACLALLLTTFSACFDDDSTDGGDFQDISIASFEDAYDVRSFVGQHLQITPEISTSVPAEQLEYSWTLTDDEDESSTTTISTARNLDYEVNLAPGSYTVLLVVRNTANDYIQTQSTTLNTSTSFSQGFYILKEDAEGNSDLDLLLGDGTFSEDILSQIREDGALQGAPLTLNVAYAHCYIDEETNEMTYGNMLSVSTYDGQIALFRTDDMQQIYSNENICYEPLSASVQPYTVYTGYFDLHFLTSEGVMSGYSGSVYGGYTSGIYGMPDVETGGSKYIANDAMYSCYWDETNHQIYSCDWNGGVALCTTMMGEEVDLSDYDCVSAGTNIMGSICFLLKNRTTGKLVVHELTYGFYSLDTIYEVPDDAAINGADDYSFNYLQATVIYGAKDNKVYAYDYYNDIEQELQLKGLGSGETISYVSNQFCAPYTGTEFDYLFVCTTTATGYTLYAYEMLGGMADGDPVYKVSGTGRPCSVRYVSPTYDSMYAFSCAIPLCD